jgi:hypothetical protein
VRELCIMPTIDLPSGENDPGTCVLPLLVNCFGSPAPSARIL